MTEEEFLSHYDIAAFDRPSVATDIVVMSVTDTHLNVLLQTRAQHPFSGLLALPGGFVGIEETLEDCATRVLAEKANLTGLYLEQLATFGALDRDPRGRIISCAYLALVQPDFLQAAALANPKLSIAQIGVVMGPQKALTTCVVDGDGQASSLAFDHAHIIEQAVFRLANKIDYVPIAFAFLPELFTLRQVQNVYEAVLGTQLNKPAFRRKLLDTRWIEGTGIFETGAAFRPAELYRRK